MEKITTFVENIFFDFPKTEEVAKLKMQLIDSLAEKYQALLDSGKNENEAFGILIAEFGSMEELKKQFDIPNYKADKKESEEAHSAKIHTEEISSEAKKYREEFFAYQTKFAIQIGLGVFCCILGLIISSSLKGPQSAAGFFLPVSIGVFLFIIAGIKQSALKKLAGFEGGSNAENSSFEFGGDDPITKIIMLSAFIVFLLLGFLTQYWHPAWLVFPIGALLSTIIKIFLRAFK